MPNILFDFDGTLFDTYPGISKSIANMLSELKLKPLKDGDYNRFIGPPVHMSFHDCFDLNGEDLEHAVTVFRKYYAESGVYDSRPYEGIPEMLARLKARGFTLAIASSKPQFAIEKLLAINNLTDYFDKVAGADGVERSADKTYRLKAAASEREAVMVGDRKYDMAAAKNLGFKAVGVTYGFGSREELLEAGADIVVDSVSALEEYLMKLK